MEPNILVPKYKKNKKPVKVRKPSRPIDGINHRLLREQATLMLDAHVKIAPVEQSDDAAPNREELIQKANELGLTFGKRTSNKMLATMITQALSKQGA